MLLCLLLSFNYATKQEGAGNVSVKSKAIKAFCLLENAISSSPRIRDDPGGTTKGPWDDDEASGREIAAEAVEGGLREVKGIGSSAVGREGCEGSVHGICTKGDARVPGGGRRGRGGRMEAMNSEELLVASAGSQAGEYEMVDAAR